ncbi:MAG: transposase [Gemmatimonadota bacterium]|nr:transposase [Gemmatimonadota bacterium]
MRKPKRHFGVEEKLRILEEARSPGTIVAEVLRRHGLDGATYYRWEKQAQEGMRQALVGKPPGPATRDRWVERYNEERLHAGIEYLPPAEYYRDPPARLQERRSKLEQGRARREQLNRKRLRQAA